MKIRKEMITFKIIFSEEEMTTLLIKFLEYMQKNVTLKMIGRNALTFIGDYPIEASLAKLFCYKRLENHEKNGDYSISIAVNPADEGKLHKHFHAFFAEIDMPVKN